MPSTPLTCCSMGSATVSITVRALAPGYRVVTWTVGGTTSGYWATGKTSSATAPITMVRIAMTLARTGRSMKNFEIIGDPSVRAGARRLGRGRRLRIDFLAGDCPQQAVHDHLIGGRNSFFDHP